VIGRDLASNLPGLHHFAYSPREGSGNSGCGLRLWTWVVMTRGVSKRRAELSRLGLARRAPGTGASLREPMSDRDRFNLPVSLREGLDPVMLAAATGEAERLWHAFDAYQRDREDLVLELRLLDVSWAGIGFLLGVSGQSVRAQYDDRVEARIEGLLADYGDDELGDGVRGNGGE
jgi:hypothetical protein